MTLVVGLTGGIGSGKSAVAAEFARRGAEIADADAIVHELSAVGAPGHHALAAAFGAAALAPGGELDRAWIRQQAFGDPTFRARLESILHPMVRSELARRVAVWQAPYGLIVVPLLLERGDARDRAQRILVVDCPEDEQVRRVGLRSGLGPAEVRAIMATQLSRAERLAQADDVIDNSGPLTALGPQVERLDARYRQLSVAAGRP